MPIERNAPKLAEFYKFTRVGQAVAGRITKIKHNDNGPIATVSPVLIRRSRNAKWERFAEVAIGLSTDARVKVDMARDTGKFMLFEFDSTEPTSKGSPRKIFRVAELSRDEMMAYAESATAGESINEPADSEQASSPLAEDDDLPF